MGPKVFYSIISIVLSLLVLGSFSDAKKEYRQSLTEAELTNPSIRYYCMEDEAVAYLANTDEIQSVERLGGGDSLTLKLNYKRGISGVFKVNHYKVKDGKKRGPYFPYRYEISAYLLSKALGFILPPTTKMQITKTKLLSLAADKKKLALLIEERAYCKEDEMLSGSIQLFILGKPGLPVQTSTGSDRTTRNNLLLFAKELNQYKHSPRIVFRLMSNLIVFDALCANNDRAGNILYDKQRDLLYPIDHDDSFVDAVNKKGEKLEQFFRALLHNCSIFDERFGGRIKALLESNTDRQLHENFFVYGNEKLLTIKQVQQLRARFYDEILPWVEQHGERFPEK